MNPYEFHTNQDPNWSHHEVSIILALFGSFGRRHSWKLRKLMLMIRPWHLGGRLNESIVPGENNFQSHTLTYPSTKPGANTVNHGIWDSCTSASMVYLPIHVVDFCGKSIGKYTVRPMDASWELFLVK